MKLIDLNIIYKEVTLNNGTRLFLFNKKGSPITIRIVFWAGARFGEIPGLSHFTEHLLVSGTENYPTKDKLSARLENIGGYFSAKTGSDFLSFDINIADQQDLPVAFEIIDEILHKSKFEPNNIENERKAILSEISKKVFNPGQNIFDVFRKVLYQNTRLEQPVLGTPESVSAISNEDLTSYYKDNIFSTKPTIFIAGDFSEDEVVESLNNVLKNNTKIQEIPTAPLPSFFDKKVEIMKYDGEHLNARIGYRIGELTLKEKMTLLVIQTILSKGRSAILTNELRYKRGLLYEISSSLDFSIDRGYFSVNFSTNRKRVNEVFNIIKAELLKIKQYGISEEQLSFVKRKILKTIKFDLQTSHQIIEYFYEDLMLNDDNNASIDNWFDVLNNLSLDEINSVAKTNIDLEKMVIGICGSLEENEILELSR